MINFESRRPEPLRRLAHKAAEIIPMSWIRPAALMRVDRGMFRLSRGRTTFSALASGLPIVMLTAFKDRFLEQQAFNAGVSWVLSKTEDVSTVVEFARILLSTASQSVPRA